MASRRTGISDYLLFSAFFTLVAAFSLLLTALSTPFDNSLYVFRLGSHTGEPDKARFVDFGIFGGREEELSGMIPRCSGQMLGWTIGSDVTNYLNVPSDVHLSISKTATTLFVFHPLAAFFSFVAIGPNDLPPNSGYFKLVRYFVHIALVITSAAFLANIIIVSEMQGRVGSLSSEDWKIKLRWGNVIIANIFALLLLFLSAVYTNKLKRPVVHEEDQTGHSSEARVGHQLSPITMPEPRPFEVAPTYKASQGDQLLEAGQGEAPPAYATTIQSPTASTSGSRDPPAQEPLAASSTGSRFNFFRFNQRTS
ncbi:hypothetical protein D9756_002396 [Leucocoprinus leucothites]|uniref:Uncharacterized protein n=1 Tax=Leucocoprinus leucothites TaxID=201217 RepID=A0A8H5GBD5_9AGAR|nr:hypothetical protein D9756_002396 [Leucoagaricus leucothites]